MGRLEPERKMSGLQGQSRIPVDGPGDSADTDFGLGRERHPKRGAATGGDIREHPVLVVHHPSQRTTRYRDNSGRSLSLSNLDHPTTTAVALSFIGV